MNVKDFLDKISGNKVRTPDITVWVEDTSTYEQQWDSVARRNACVYDYYATASLVSYLLRTSELSYSIQEEGLHIRAQNDMRSGSHLLNDPRVLHPLIFYEKVYLNLTNGIKYQTDWEKLKGYGLVDEYPKPISREYINTYMALKPLLLDYTKRIVDDVYGLFAYEQWGEGIRGPQSYTSFLSLLYDEMAKNRCGLESYYMSLWGALRANVRVVVDMAEVVIDIRDVVVDTVETVISGYSQMTDDSMALFTLAQSTHEDQGIDTMREKRMRDDTFVLFQTALGNELSFIPQVKTLEDVLRVREDKTIARFRELFGHLNRAIHKSDEDVLREIHNEIVHAKKSLSRLDFIESRWFAWATGLLGFIPIIGSILDISGIVLYEAKELAKKKNNWIYIGCRS